MKKILVFGGAGFIGSHLVEALVLEGNSVTVVDDFSNGKYENLKESKDKINTIHFDISQKDWSTLEKLDPDLIFHLATHPRSFSFSDPQRNLNVNVLGTINILEFARKKNSKVIYTSNSGICGNPKSIPITEDHPIDCKTPYDANKLIGENYAKIYFETYGVYTTSFRLATVYGERQRINLKLRWRPLIPQLVYDVESENTPIINWDGKQTRDLVHVSDVVKCLILGAKSEKHGGEMFLVSSNTETSVNEAFRLICKLSGKNPQPTYVEKNPGDIRRMVISYQKAKNSFGYQPEIQLEDGIRRYISWYRKNLVDS